MAYSMAKTETYLRKFGELCRLEIDPGRYLAIDEDGEYVISTKSQPIRGAPYGEWLRNPLVLGGAPPPGNPKYRVFVIDADETVDFVVIGTLAVHDSWIWVAGDRIRHEYEEYSKFVGFLTLVASKLLVSKFPKKNPQKMSANQIWAAVKKQTFNKMFADIGIEAPKTDNNAQLRFVKLFAHIGIEPLGRSEVTIADEVYTPDEVKALEEERELSANWKTIEASFYWTLEKGSTADEEKARKEDEKWEEQPVDGVGLKWRAYLHICLLTGKEMSEEAPDIDNKKHKLQEKEACNEERLQNDLRY